ncbi:OLC1v1015762C1 [Oldenlandia corymbosa var. corymbosa]|uniref:OLC1v1015762C1 n=1 Tax=Oldenlandia corymbosa var. corymbosa TaxID=529605 RepID=A0AAV1E690_OLDCO|nr:OLC1v1015762C1 [Oldenlandia corymbosa var. corymbosa]
MASNSQTSSQVKEKAKGNYFTWTPELEKVLGTCLIDQMAQGNKCDRKLAWKSSSWTAAIKALYVHQKTWAKHHEILYPLLVSSNSDSPITWDYVKGRIAIHDENVWNERLQANPQLAPYRNKIVIENWNDICAIFSQDRADGQGAATFEENNAENEVNSFNIGDPSEEIHNQSEAMRLLLARQKRKEGTSSACSQGSRKKPTSMQAPDYMTQMAPEFSDYILGERKKTKLVIAQKTKITPQQILSELKEIDLDNMQKIKAVDMMILNRVMFDTFVGFLVELKYKWLMAKLDKEN